MMNKIDDNVQSQCRGCLSIGRKLTAVGKYSDLYCKLIVDHLYGIRFSTKDVQLCWECFSLLKKILQFQLQLRKVNEIFSIGQTYVYGTFSSLTTITIHDTNPNIIYFNETHIKCNKVTQNNTHNDDSNDSISDDDHNDAAFNNDETELKNDDEVKSESDKKHNKDAKIEDTNLIERKPVKNKVKINKWAKKRALLKVPKFKILNKEHIDINKYFRKEQIDVENVKNWMERERDEERFKKARFKCETCVLKFKNTKLLMKHNDKCHERATGKYICDICKQRMLRKSHLLHHINKHTISYKCKLCDFTCRSKENIKTHLNNAHKTVYQCLKCPVSFGCRWDVFKHYKNWHEKYICDYCGISFVMRYSIENHIKKQHSPFECVPCKKRFSRYNGLWVHKKVCHSVPCRDSALPTTAYCVECDKRFVDVYRYKWHLHNSVRHTPKKKRRIPCPDCDKVFSKNIYMKDHYNFVHLKNYKFRCEECDKNFVRNAELVKHRRRIHEGILPPKNKICYVCGRGFTTNEILTRHLRTHSGERPHGCDACPAAFAQRVALLAHKRTRHPNTNAT